MCKDKMGVFACKLNNDDDDDDDDDNSSSPHTRHLTQVREWSSHNVLHSGCHVTGEDLRHREALGLPRVRSACIKGGQESASC